MMLSFQYLTSSQDKKKDKAIEVSPPQTLCERERERTETLMIKNTLGLKEADRSKKWTGAEK